MWLILSADYLREIYRRAHLEFVVELPLLKERWKTILFGACMQYVHGLFTQLAHRMHKPQNPPLHDLGFEYIPELGKLNEWVSETIFTTLLVSFILWSFSPFVFSRKRFYTAVMYNRILTVLVICQMLRVISFTVTQLPAPNYHCRAGEPTAIRAPAEHWWQHFYINDLKRQATHGCGDLIFSSHTTFALVGVLTYTEYGSRKMVKAIIWVAAVVLSSLIVSSRKHYTVDVVIAWYVVPLVFWHMHRRWTTKRIVEEWPHRPPVQEVMLESIIVEGPPLSIAPTEPLLPTMSRISSASVLPLAVKTFANGTGGSGVLQGGVRGGQGHAQGPPTSPSPPRGDHGADDGGIMAGGSRPYGSTTVMRPRGGGGGGSGVGIGGSYPSQDPLSSGEPPQWREDDDHSESKHLTSSQLVSPPGGCRIS